MDGKIKKLIEERDLTIERINGQLSRSVSGVQKKLLEEFMTGFADKLQLDADGVVKNNVYNRNLLLSLDKLFTDFTKKNAPILINEIVSGVGSIMDFNSKFYSNFEPETKLLPIKKKVRESVGLWLGIKDGSATENGYLRTLVGNDSARNEIKNVAMKTILSQEGFFASKEKLKQLIDGDGERMGAMQKYYRNFTYDLYSQVDRATAQTYAEDLKFEFAIYEGGLVERSRKFCKEHNGKVYHKSEIASFKLTEAEPPNYNPFTDLGGYGCRHHLNWVPNSLAFAMRPDARKFVEGAGEPEPKKPEPAKSEKKPKTKTEEPKVIDVEPLTPRAVRDTKIEKIKTVDDAKTIVSEIFPDAKIIKLDFDNLPAEQTKKYLRKINELMDEYVPTFKNVMEINFKSIGNELGSVSYFPTTNRLASINFGNKSHDLKNNVRKDDAEYYRRHSVIVDDDNIDYYTLTHEFGHVLSQSKRHDPYNETLNSFWKEIKALRTKYKKELSKLTGFGSKDLNLKEANDIFLGNYASTNVDEFWAEAWTEYKLSSKPSKYAVEVGKVAEKYFKKSK